MLEKKRERGEEPAPYFNTHACVVLPSAVADFVVFVDLKSKTQTKQQQQQTKGERKSKKYNQQPLCREVRES